MRKLESVLTSLIVCITLSSTCRAQHWKQIGKLDPYPCCGYFWDKLHGVVVCNKDDGDASINTQYGLSVYITSNGGSAWLRGTLPSDWQASQAVPWGISFDSRTHGLLATSTQSPSLLDSAGVYETFDGGLTWALVPASSQYRNVGFFPCHRVIYSNGGIAVLNDSEAVLTTGVPPTATAQIRQYMTVYLTTDTGATWQSVAETGETWGLGYASRSGMMLAYAEKYRGGPPEYTSRDGVNWTPGNGIFDPGCPYTGSYTTGDCEGAGNALYVQTCSGNGLYRTTDFGLTWKNIGGPSNGLDTRFCVVQNCSGGTVIAFGRDGSVWETTDGGDGALPELHEKGSGTLSIGNYVSVSSCSTAQFVGVLFSNDCGNGLTIHSLDLTGDTSYFSLTGLGSLPLALGGGATDTFRVLFDPHHTAGTFSVSLHLHGLVRQQDGAFDSAIVYDTTVTLTARSLPQSPALTSAVASLDLGGVSLCSPGVDTVFEVTNSGCAPDTIYSFSAAPASSGFTVDGTALPIVIPPDSTIRIRIHFTPPGAGSAQGTLTVNAQSQGLRSSLGVSLSARGTTGGTAGGTALALQDASGTASTTLDLGTLSICSSDTVARFTLSNDGCDTLQVTSVTIAPPGASGFDLEGPADTVLGGSGSASYRVRFHPVAKGSFTARVRIRAQSMLDPSQVIDTTIAIRVVVTDGTKLLEAASTNFDLGSHTVCDAMDTSVVLRNTGCDTVWVTSASFGSASGFTVDTSSLPFALAPGEARSLPVHATIDTAGHPLTESATLSVSSTSSVPLVPITFRTGIQYPAHLGLELTDRSGSQAPTLAAGGGSDVVFVLHPEGAVPSAIHTIDLSIVTNEDLLSFRSVEEPYVTLGPVRRRADGMTERELRLAPPVIDSHTTATLHYTAYLSKDSTAPVSLENIRLNGEPASATACLALVDSSAAGFEYEYACGEGLVSQFLRLNEVVVTGEPPYPDPLTAASGFRVAIPFTTRTTGLARLRMFTSAGREVWNESMAVYAPGRHYYYIAAGELPGGVYHYVIEFPDGHPAVRRSLVIEK